MYQTISKPNWKIYLPAPSIDRTQILQQIVRQRYNYTLSFLLFFLFNFFEIIAVRCQREANGAAEFQTKAK